MAVATIVLPVEARKSVVATVIKITRRVRGSGLGMSWIVSAWGVGCFDIWFLGPVRIWARCLSAADQMQFSDRNGRDLVPYMCQRHIHVNSMH